MENIGDVLRSARQAKGISLRDAEEATKIRLRYLEALENNEYEQIPGRVYVLGFLRNYASYLGLDAQELTERYKEQYPAKEDLYSLEEISGSSMPRLASRKTNYWLLILGAFIFLWGVNWLYNYYQSSYGQSPPPQAIDPGLIIEPQPNEQPSPVVPEPQTDGVEVKLKASGDCWTEVVVDGANSFSFYETMRAGDEQVFRGDKEITLHLGSAGMINITVNGQTWPSLGKIGEVVTVTFKPDSIPPDVGEGVSNE